VIVFVYSLGLATDLYESLFPYADVTSKRKYVEGADIYYNIQPFNKQLTGAGIALILSAVSLFVFNTHKRRKYYVGNYVTVVLNAIVNVGVTVWALVNIMAYKAQYLSIDFAKLAELADRYDTKYIESTRWFDASVPVFTILIAVSLVSIANLVFKVLLMRSERQLIEEGAEEV
jgi:membrane-associated phospholipid phosphatase